MYTHAHLLMSVSFYQVLTAASDILFCPRLLSGWNINQMLQIIMNFTLAFSKASQGNKSENVKVKEREIIEVILESKNEIQCFSYSQILNSTNRLAGVLTDLKCVLWQKCAINTFQENMKVKVMLHSKHLQSKSLQLTFSQSHSFHTACSHIRLHS